MSEKPAIRVIEALFATQWAMTEDYLRSMLAIADRAHEITPKALEAMRSKRVADAAESLSVRDGVGIISVRGPMFRYADFFSSISGATTYEGFALDMRRAADDAGMRAILLNVDSPGGDVNGVQEAAAMIREIDIGRKPVVAYVGGMGASAAYLLSAAARQITLAPNAIVGSIGVRSAVRDTTARDERLGVKNVEFVSSQSPNKAMDINTDEGRARIQATVDKLAEAFIKQVADYRGLTPEQVISQFGQGGVEVGERAVASGMADRIGSFEATLAELARGLPAPPAFRLKPKGAPIMVERTAEQVAADQRAHDEEITRRARAEGAAAATARVTQILALDESKGREALARQFALTTDLPVETVKGLLTAAPKEAPAAPTPPARTDNARRSADQPGGLVVHADEPAADSGKGGRTTKDVPMTAIDTTALYEKFSGRGKGVVHPAN